MLAVRLGSYSTRSTLPATPALLRLKSTRRYRRLCPPPRRRLVTCPCWLRPPDFSLAPSVSDFSGRPLCVTSAKSLTERNRVPAVMGLNCLVGIVLHPL